MKPSALPGMPPVAFAPVDGFEMAFYQAGPGASAEAPAVVFLHGFPELAYSWRHQLAFFSAAGRRVVAPDQRGYGLTGPHGDEDEYDVPRLAADLVELLNHLGLAKVIWCGHDWGGGVAWNMALRHPSRTAGVIGVNTPWRPPGARDPVEQLRRRHGDRMYVVEFQEPGLAEAILDADPRRTLQFFMRCESGVGINERGCGDGWTLGQLPLLQMLRVYDPNRDRRRAVLSPPELDVFTSAFEATGFGGGVNWYRNLSRNWRAAAALPRTIDVPALMVTAEQDPVLPPSAADGMEAHVPDLRTVLIRGAGHWTQQERPQELNAAIKGWLDRRFPAGAP